MQAEFNDLDYLASHFLEQEDFESAAMCYQQIIRDNPEDARAYYNLAIVLNDLGKFDESFESLICFIIRN